MKIVWIVVLCLATATKSTDCSQLSHSTQHKVKTQISPFIRALEEIDSFNEKQQANIKEYIQKNYCSAVYDKKPFQCVIQQPSSIEDQKQLNYLCYRPLRKIINTYENSTTVEIVLSNFFDKKKETFIAINKGVPYSHHYRCCIANYKPRPGTLYTFITSNEDCSLIAAGYDKYQYRDKNIDRIDIIHNSNLAHLTKLLTIIPPEKEKVLNIAFSQDNNHVLLRTQENVYTYNIQRAVQHSSSINAAIRTINNSDATTKDILQAFVACKRIYQQIQYQPSSPIANHSSKEIRQEKRNTDRFFTEISPSHKIALSAALILCLFAYSVY